MRRLLLAAVAALVPLAVSAQDGSDNPYRTAKVGDYATYALTAKFGTAEVNGTMTTTVKGVTARDVTVEVTGTVNGMPTPPQTQTIDITKAFDPAAVGLAKSAGKDTKVERVADVKEKLTVGGKTYEATLTTLKVTTKTPAGDVVADVRAWVGKDIPLGLGRMEVTSTVAGVATTMKLEQTESGSKK